MHIKGDEDTVLDLDCYTIPESARALRRSPLTVKRWIKDGMIPKPRLKDFVYGYDQYSVGELQTIAKALAEHDKKFSYFHISHIQTIQKIREALEEYRKTEG